VTEQIKVLSLDNYEKWVYNITFLHCVHYFSRVKSRLVVTTLSIGPHFNV
jgi:hypothetical protein